MTTLFRILIPVASLTLLACGSAPRRPAEPAPVASPAAKAPAPQPARRLPALDAGVEGVAVGTGGAVASAETHATNVGIDVMKRGGNAIDAAVAVAFALAVTHPSAGNLGGGGFMVVYPADGPPTAIDYRETAPGAATADMYLDDEGNPTRDSLRGPRAAGIPGTVAGMALAHERFGSLSWSELLEPAIELAKSGHVIDEDHARDLARGVSGMREAGYERAAENYLAEDGAELEAGDRWVQPQLGRTLGALAEHGPRYFYEGELAERLAEGVRAMGGLWTAQDLARYRAIEREPVAFDYAGHRVISMPPPSAGGVVMRQILGARQLLDGRRHGWLSVPEVHLYAEAARRSYADRNYLLGDPAFADVPAARLTSMDYIKKRMSGIDPEHATPSEQIEGGEPLSESRETTHFSVIDGAGNAVSNTYTLNTGFGSKVVVKGTGILLNNEMDDFASKPGTPNVYGLVQGERNKVEPHKRMLSSMTPTVIAKDGKVRAVIGSPGGPTITNTVTRIAIGLMDYGLRLDEAVAAPRLHHQWKPDVIIVEPGIDESLTSGLEELGHRVVESRWGRMGHANCVEVDPATGGFRAVADVGRDGGAAAAF